MPGRQHARTLLVWPFRRENHPATQPQIAVDYLNSWLAV